MRKKLLECPVHGLSLFRCKIRCWHDKPTEWSTEYTEKCFKCISEGRIKKKETIYSPRKKHITLRE